VLQLNLNVGSTGYDRLADITLATEVNATASLHINSATGVAKDNTYDPNTGLGVELLDTNNNSLVDTLRVHLQDGASGDDDGSSNGRIQTSLLLANAPRSTVYRFYNQRSGVHFYTPDEGERDNVILNSYGAGTSYEKLKANPASIDPLTGGWGYSFEGIAYQALETQGTALYRFYNASKGYHFLSTSAEEANNVIKNSLGAGFDLNNAINKDPITGGWGYKYEGTTYKVSTIAQHGMDQAVYRFYNVNKGVHFYTASSDERDNVIRNSVGGSYVGQLDQARNAELLSSGWGYSYEGIGWYV
jgi:cold shock CspA family protein